MMSIKFTMKKITYTVYDKNDYHIYSDYFNDDDHFAISLRYQIEENYSVKDWYDAEVKMLKEYSPDFIPIDMPFITIVVRYTPKYEFIPDDYKVYKSKTCALKFKCQRNHFP